MWNTTLEWVSDNSGLVFASTLLVLCVVLVLGVAAYDRRASIKAYWEHRRSIRIQRGLVMGRKNKAEREAYLKQVFGGYRHYWLRGSLVCREGDTRGSQCVLSGHWLRLTAFLIYYLISPPSNSSQLSKADVPAGWEYQQVQPKSILRGVIPRQLRQLRPQPPPTATAMSSMPPNGLEPRLWPNFRRRQRSPFG